MEIVKNDSVLHVYVHTYVITFSVYDLLITLYIQKVFVLYLFPRLFIISFTDF